MPACIPPLWSWAARCLGLNNHVQACSSSCLIYARSHLPPAVSCNSNQHSTTMAVCEQSGEPRLFAELDEFGLSSGEPPEELYSGTFFEEKNYPLPLTDGEVGKICK